MKRIVCITIPVDSADHEVPRGVPLAMHVRPDVGYETGGPDGETLSMWFQLHVPGHDFDVHKFDYPTQTVRVLRGTNQPIPDAWRWLASTTTQGLAGPTARHLYEVRP